MAKMSGGEALAKSLANEGVEVVFGIPGIQIYGIVAGLRGRAKYSHDIYSARTGDHIHGRWICPRIRKTGKSHLLFRMRGYITPQPA